MQLIVDVYLIILSFIHPYHYNKFKLVCKFFYRHIKNLSDDGMKVCLTPKQREIVTNLSLNPRSAIIQAPLSFGKTITALALATRFMRCVIAVPPVLMEQWIEEAIKVYGKKFFNPKSLESPLFVANQQISKLHYNWCRNQETNSSPRILLISGYSLNKLYNHNHYKAEVIIIDECQKGELFRRNYNEYTSQNVHLFGLTADTKYGLPKNVKPPIEKITTGKEEITSFIPKYQVSYLMYEETFKIKDIAPQVESLDLKGYTILYYSSYHFGTLTLSNVNKYFSVPIYFHSCKDSYSKFSQSPREENPILVYSYERGCEGLNLNSVQNIVLVSPNRVNYQRINQAIGRSLRVNNPNTLIRVEGFIPEDAIEQAIAFKNIIHPYIYEPFLELIKAKKPAFNFTWLRWELFCKYGLDELEFYILFHANISLNIVMNWCQEQGLFTNIPKGELDSALRGRKIVKRKEMR